MAYGVAKLIGAGALGIAAVAAAAFRGPVPAAAPATDNSGAEWRDLAIGPIAAGSRTGRPAAPGRALEQIDEAAAPARQDQTAAGPVRLTGTAGTDLNRAMRAAGVPRAIAEEYLRALATRIALADGISIADRFDLVVVSGPGGDALVYAGLDRIGARDVQLMRWAQGGQAGWVDAEGTAAQAEAMRMPVGGSVTSAYGMRDHPVLGARRFHRGLDLRAAAGTPIRASADGQVAFSGWSGGYGRQVRLAHGDGLTTSYSHMSRIAAAPGGRVRRGDVIGYVGSSGLSTGPHLHYEVFKNGRPVNPATVRYAGGASMEREERHAFNAQLRRLLAGDRS